MVMRDTCGCDWRAMLRSFRLIGIHRNFEKNFSSHRCQTRLVLKTIINMVDRSDATGMELERTQERTPVEACNPCISLVERAGPSRALASAVKIVACFAASW